MVVVVVVVATINWQFACYYFHLLKDAHAFSFFPRYFPHNRKTLKVP